MITVNNREYEYEKDTSISELMEQFKYNWPKIYVTVNGEFIEKDKYETTIVKDGDKVGMIHLLAGG